MKKAWQFITFILSGLIVGYWLKDNISKPDEHNEYNQKIKQRGKGNVIGKTLQKIKDRKKKPKRKLFRRKNKNE